MPVIQSLLPLNEVIQLPNFFDALDIVLLSVDPDTGEALRDGNGDLIKYNFGNTNWIPLMLRNSSFIIHPEEILADNFATLMEWRSDGVLPRQIPTASLSMTSICSPRWKTFWRAAARELQASVTTSAR